MKTLFHKLFGVAILVLLASCSASMDERRVFSLERGVAIGDGQYVILTDPSQNISSLFKVTEADARRFTGLGKPGEECRISPVTDADKDTLMYICNFDDGWMIVSGDRRTDPILAEGDEGSFSLETAHEGVLTWLGCLADDIRGLKQSGSASMNDNVRRWKEISPNVQHYYRDTTEQTRIETDYRWVVVTDSVQHIPVYSGADVPHLIETKWGQGYPWNTKLPMDISCWSMCKLGCVAVAISQLLYFTNQNLGKPTGLYHTISIGQSYISEATTNIGFQKSDYNAVSTRWAQMALDSASAITNSVGGDYVVDLVLEVGNRVNTKYSGSNSSAQMSATHFSNYGLSCFHSDYDFATVKNSLENDVPVIVTAFDSVSYLIGNLFPKYHNGHAWIIDGMYRNSTRFMYHKHCIHTEDWANYPNAEVYEYFGQVRAKYGIDDPSDPILDDAGVYSSYYWLMNWGANGHFDNDHFHVSDSAWVAGSYRYRYEKEIYYGFE